MKRPRLPARFAASRTGVWPTLLLGLVLLAAPGFLNDWRLTQIAQLMCYGIFAMSLSFLWGQAGLVCFGHAIFFGIGGYAMTLVTKGMLAPLPRGTAFGLLAATALPAALAWGAGALLFRGRGLSGAFFAIVTLAAAVVAERAASHWAFIGGFNGLMDVPPLRIAWGAHAFELIDGIHAYYGVLVFAAAIYLLLLWVERTPAGTTLRALRDSESRTAFLGADIAAIKTAAFALSAAVAGLAGGLFVTQFGFVSPSLIGVPLSTEVLIWTALGGREVLLAAFMGALIVRSVESALSDALGAYWLLGLGALFVASVVVFPSGLLGKVLALPLPRRLRRG